MKGARARVALACVTALALAACATAKDSGHNSGGSSAGVSGDRIALGTSNALTGPVASVCLPVSAGAGAWFQHVNATGGVHGRKIDVTVLDDGYQAPRAAANVRTLQEKKVFALFGGCGTVTAAVIANAVKGSDLPYLFPYAALPDLVRPAKPNVYSLLPLYDDQARALVAKQLKADGPGSVYAVTSQIPGYEADVQGVKDGIGAGGGTFAGSTLLPAVNAPAAQAALKVGTAHPDYAMLTVLAPDAARLLNAMAGAGDLPRKAILGVSVLASQAFAAALAPGAATLLRTVSPTVPLSDPRAADCLAALRTYAPKTTPDAFALYGCAAAQVFVAALQAAGRDLTRSGLLAALEAMHGTTASSLLPPVTFTKTQHLGIESMFLLALSGGRFRTAGTVPVGVAG